MADLHQTLIPILSSMTFLLVASHTALSQTISFNYDFTSARPTDLTYQGDAYFPSNTSYLRLTEARMSYIGRVLYSNAIQFWGNGGQIDFQTTINFLVTDMGVRNPADGVTFFIAPVGSTIPENSTGGSLGIFNSSGTGTSVFAVEFDISWNREWDPMFSHIGVDLGSRVSKRVVAVGDAFVGQLVTARINYAGATKMINVHVKAGSKTFNLGYKYDLSSFLPQQVQVGISASTGAEYALHEIASWDFSATVVHTAGG